MDATNPQKIVFTFIYSAELEQDVEEFWNNTARVEPKEFFNTLKTTKARIFSVGKYTNTNEAN